MWRDSHEFSASAITKKDNKVVGSTSGFTESDFADAKKLGEELGVSEEKMSEIIEKGNELYEDFYGKQ